jgi:hypothetical protein
LGQPVPGVMSFRPWQANEAAETAARDFFQGLNVSPGSATRRSLSAINEKDLTASEQRIRKQGHFTALANAAMKDKTQVLQLAGQLPDVLRTAQPSR